MNPKQKRVTESLACILEESLSGRVRNADSYDTCSNIMRGLSGNNGWCGLESVNPLGRYERSPISIFEKWVDLSIDILRYRYSRFFTNSNHFLDRLESDIKWWGENHSIPGQDNISLIKISKNHGLHNREYNCEVLFRWHDIWLDSGWFKSEELLNNFLISAVSSNNVRAVDRLVNEFGISLNQRLVCKNSLNKTLSKDVSTSSPAHAMKVMRAGFFVRKWEMANKLTEMGFNWLLEDEFGVNSLSHLHNKNKRLFDSETDRLELLAFINNLNLNLKFNNGEKTDCNRGVINILKSNNGSKKKQDEVAFALRWVDWGNLRGEGGENLLHILAKYTAPSIFKRYATTKKGIKLFSQKDNKGVLPLEYFLGITSHLCFRSSNKIDWIKSLIKDKKIPEPDWLEAKWVSFIERTSGSLVDYPKTCDMGDTWKQKSANDFKESLRTERGRAFLKNVIKNYGGELLYYKKTSTSLFLSKDNSLHLNEWLGGDFEFFKFAKTKDEVAVAVWEAWNKMASIYSNNQSIIGLPINEDHVKHTENIMEKAISMEIDLAKMKSEVVEGKRVLYSLRGDIFDSRMGEVFTNWKALESITEKRRLMKVITNKSNPNRSDVENKDSIGGMAL